MGANGAPRGVAGSQTARPGVECALPQASGAARHAEAPPDSSFILHLELKIKEIDTDFSTLDDILAVFSTQKKLLTCRTAGYTLKIAIHIGLIALSGQTCPSAISRIKEERTLDR